MSRRSVFGFFEQRVLSQSPSTSTRVVGSSGGSSNSHRPVNDKKRKKKRAARDIDLLSGLAQGLKTQDTEKTWYLYTRLLQRDKQPPVVVADTIIFGSKQPIVPRRLVNTAHTHLPHLHSKILEHLQPKFRHGYTQRDIDRAGERAQHVVQNMGRGGIELTSEDVEHLLHCFVRNAEAIDQIWQYATLSGVVRDIGCFNCYLNAKMWGKQYERAFAVVEEIVQAGLEPNEYTRTCLIRLYGLTGDLAAARRVFDDEVSGKSSSSSSSSSSVHVYNAMLDVLGMNGLVEEMRHLFLQMTGLVGRDLSELTRGHGSGGVSPNRGTFHALIKWHATYWDVDTAAKYVRVMSEVFGVRPVAKTFKLIITRKTAVREFQKCAAMAVLMSEEHGVEPPGFVVRTLERASKRLADMEQKVKESEAQRSSVFSGLFD